MEYTYVWLIAGILLLILEIFTADFLFASIGLSCLIASIPAYFGVSVYLQIAIFAIFSVLIFAFVRPFAKKVLQGENHAKELGLNTLVNKKGVVTEKIVNSQNIGRVKIDADQWRAYSNNGEEIEEGTSVIVKKAESITVYVEKESTDSSIK